jgi:hypothetical protein
MSRDLPESDWKTFRRLREIALARFCERVLGEIGTIASTGATSCHDRYLKIYRLIDNRDEELARAFNNPRRSRAILQLAAINSYVLLSEEDCCPLPRRPGTLWRFCPNLQRAHVDPSAPNYNCWGRAGSAMPYSMTVAARRRARRPTKECRVEKDTFAG